jgi:hypothetical protein
MDAQMVQELKSERVQEELAVEDPGRIWLKSERVQEPAVFGGGGESGGGGNVVSFFELSLNRQQAVTIELLSHQVVITLHGPMTGGAAEPGAARTGA